jgi:GNAT superfamily N-acetyltransferase
MRGYIAMLAVTEEYRGKGVATKLVCRAVDAMVERDADEVPLLLPPMKEADRQFLDRTRSRSHQHSGDEAVRTARLSEKQTTSSILSQWQFSLQIHAISERESSVVWR